MALWFEWDPAKAAANLRKHGVRFELAELVFADPFAMTEQDRIEGGERRWATIGMVDDLLVVFVAHTVTDLEDDDELIRIISARPATGAEQDRYDLQRFGAPEI